MHSPGQTGVGLVDAEPNPFALPPLKKARHSVNTSTTVARSGPSRLPAAGHAPSAPQVPSSKTVEPAVRFNEEVQVYPMGGHRNPSAKANVRPAFARMTAPLNSYKRPHPKSDDEMSDVETELNVLDTPTSSQQDLDTSTSLSDSDIEIVDGPAARFQSLSIKRAGSPSSSHISMSRLNKTSGDRAADESQKPRPTPAVQASRLPTRDRQNTPVPSTVIPSALPSNHERNLCDQAGIQSRRRDLRDEMQRLISDTEEARREVSKEVSMPAIHIYHF